jgi:glycosyltransferase involved in cell wall biosynthesis
VGKHETKYGEFLKDKYRGYEHIRFVGGIYDMQVLNNIRYHSNLYFHGHTVGGTNPSLLEAMASHSLICANDNAFNKYILKEDGLYFSNVADVMLAIESVQKQSPEHQPKIEANLLKVRTVFNWEEITSQYAEHFQQIALVKKEKLQLAI